jgi:hypothetical protein
MTRDLGLLATGGSDCHGNNKGRPLIGTVRIDLDLVDRVRERARSRQPAASA